MEENGALKPTRRKSSSHGRTLAHSYQEPASLNTNKNQIRKEKSRAGTQFGGTSTHDGASGSAPAAQPDSTLEDTVSIGKSDPSSVMLKAGQQAPSILEQEPIELVVHWPAGSKIDDIYAQTYGMLGQRIQDVLMKAAPSEAYNLIGKPRFAKRRVYQIGSQGRMALDMTLLIPAGCVDRIIASTYVANGRLRVGPVKLSPSQPL